MGCIECCRCAVSIVGVEKVGCVDGGRWVDHGVVASE